MVDRLRALLPGLFLLVLSAPIPANAAGPIATWRAARRAERLSHEMTELRSAVGNRSQILRLQAADPHARDVIGHSFVNGNYYGINDTHFGLGRIDDKAAFHRREQFRRGDVFVKFLDHISTRPGNNTLLIAGDWLDLLRHINADSAPETIRKLISEIVEGHRREFTALVRAVVDHGLRVLFIRGNHDVLLVDPAYRTHLMSEIVRVAGARDGAATTFRARVAFVGDKVPLGQYGEGLVVHGDERDPTNNWRSPLNPYDGARNVQQNMGWVVVKELMREFEDKHPVGADPSQKSATALTHELLRSSWNPKTRWQLAQVLRTLGSYKGGASDAETTVARQDDAEALRAWVEQSGFADVMNRSLDPKQPARELSVDEWARRLESVYAKLPTPVHERMTSHMRYWNLAKMMLGGARSVARERKSSEPIFLSLLTNPELFPNLRYVYSGHDHKERLRVGFVPGKGEARFVDGGSWTPFYGQDRLNVTQFRTDEQGRLHFVGLGRVDQETGAPTLRHNASEELLDVDGWQKQRVEEIQP
jgi:hypothetical protein